MSEGNAPADSAPQWVYDEVIHALGSRVRSVHLLKQKGGRRSVLLFSEEAALVAEKGRFSGAKVYRVEYPRGLLLNESNCPHCGKVIAEPVGKIAHLAKGEKKPRAEGHDLSKKQKEVLAYAREMKQIRKRAAKQKGGTGPIKSRAAAQQARAKHGLK